MNLDGTEADVLDVVQKSSEPMSVDEIANVLGRSPRLVCACINGFLNKGMVTWVTGNRLSVPDRTLQLVLPISVGALVEGHKAIEAARQRVAVKLWGHALVVKPANSSDVIRWEVAFKPFIVGVYDGAPDLYRFAEDVIETGKDIRRARW